MHDVIVAAVTTAIWLAVAGTLFVVARRRMRRVRQTRGGIVAVVCWRLARGAVRMAVAEIPILTARGGRRDVLAMRRDLRRSVGAAREAVRTAVGLGAPVGDLPVLQKRVEQLARMHDRTLRALSRDEPPPRSVADARREVAAVRELAASVRVAAVDAVHATSGPLAASLRADVAAETAAIAEGLRHLGAATARL